ncbi:secreted proline-rich protein [Pholiota molesta]|nr:secreted proline-rich protein [Pholiota molesta]
MAIQFWSWIFIIQIMLVRPGYAKVGHNYEVLARRALGKVFSRDLTEAEVTTRNTFTALAVTASVLLVVGLVGLFLVIWRSKRQTKVPEPESGIADVKVADGRPSWWMVEGKNEKMDWWRLSHRLESTEAPAIDTSKPVEGGRIARLKAALQRRSGNVQGPIIPMYRSTTPSPTDTLGLPIQTNPNIEPRYPESLERGYQAPIYPVQSPPQIPLLYVGDKPLKRSPTSPPRAIVTNGQRATLSRSGARAGVPRSPAVRRRDLLHRHSFRNPFLPLKTPDATTTLKISAPTPLAYIDTTNPKLTYAPSLMRPRAAPLPPSGPRGSYRPPVPPKLRKPTPLNLLNPQDNRQPLSAARVRIGLPASPRPEFRSTNSAI